MELGKLVLCNIAQVIALLQSVAQWSYNIAQCLYTVMQSCAMVAQYSAMHIKCCAILHKSLYFCAMSRNGCEKCDFFAIVCTYAQYCAMVLQHSMAIFSVVLQCAMVA